MQKEYSKDDVKPLIDTYLNNKNNRKGIEAHNQLVRLAHNNKDIHNEVSRVAKDYAKNIKHDELRNDFENCIQRVAQPSIKIERVKVESPKRIAEHVFQTPQPDDALRHNLMDAIQDRNNYERQEDGSVRFTLPNVEPNEQMKMYKIIMGATSNELGATILAMRPAEFTITLGDVGGDLDVNASQINLEDRVMEHLQNKVATYLNTLDLKKVPDAPQVSQSAAPPAPEAPARTPFSMDPADQIKKGE